MNNNEKINLLLIKLENLLVKQQGFEAEINALKQEVKDLQTGDYPSVSIREETVQPEIIEKQVSVFPPRNTPLGNIQSQPQAQAQSNFSDRFKRENIGKSDFEKFIGENLISKIGILILVIGVAIGAKLAIDKGLVSPLTRIILGYLMGAGLIAFALKLKSKYESFSAVLLSGSIAILYFITYAAYSYYQLIPQSLTFGLMVVFTSFTVIAAIKYNRQVIAHIGLVGAYAIPFLLSDGPGNVVVLFSYVAIINLGILVLAFTKYWKSLFYASFALTWIVFLGWRIPLADQLNYMKISMLFSSMYFFTFYVMNLAYKIGKKEAFVLSDVIVLLLNSFIFYGIGYYVLNLSAKSEEFLGLFTLGNAIIHFTVSLIIYKRKLADKNLFYFILALVITFITMAVPVQLNGNWVTIFWAVEAAVLFYLGRMKNISIYEKLSFPLVFLAFFSLIQDWAETAYFFSYVNDYIPVKPFFNVNFLSACIFIISFTVMFLTSRKARQDEGPIRKPAITTILSYAIPSILIIVVYYSFKNEISIVFDNLYHATKIKIPIPNTKEFEQIYNEDYRLFDNAFGYIYTLFFASTLTYLNLKKIKSKEMAVANLILNLIVILSFLTHGLYILSELRDYYLGTTRYYTSFVSGKPIDYFKHGSINIGIRYVLYAFFALLIAACYQLGKSELFKVKFKTAFDYLLYLAILWLLSSELLNILELSGLKDGYKLGLSILWGVYALILIGLGLWKNKKYLRIGAIVLFAITLLKLFFYDISSLDTISKTIVFVALGVLLLIISFLYNKYKHLVNDDDEAKN